MKKERYPVIVVAAVILLSLTGGAFAGGEREEKPRFKGVELYSWKSDRNQWVFVILDGTNRLKPTDEIKKSKSQIKGVGSLKKALAKLAKDEQVLWDHRAKGFEFPEQAIKKEIAAAAKTAEIKLSIAGAEEMGAKQPDDEKRGQRGRVAPPADD